MTETLLVIGGRPQAIVKARELGLRVVWLQHRKAVKTDSASAADVVLMLNLRDWDQALPMIRAAHSVYRFTRVVCQVDQGMELAGQVNDELALPGTSREVSRRFSDKLIMREWLRKTGFEEVAAEGVGDAAQLRDFAARYGYPVVLKPVNGTASRGVIRIDGSSEADAAWRAAVSLRGQSELPFAAYYPIDAFLAEEYLDGPEYSVEAFSWAGRHSIIAITEKSRDGFVETGHAMPAILDPDTEAAIRTRVTGYLEAMELRDGASHTEIKLTTKGVRIVEGHDRVAGGRIMDLIEAVYGVDLERLAVGAPFGLFAGLPKRPEPNGAAATRFLTAPPGRVTAIRGIEPVLVRPGVLDVEVGVQVGDVVPPVADNFCRSGQVLAAAADTAAAVGLAASLAAAISIVTEPGGLR